MMIERYVHIARGPRRVALGPLVSPGPKYNGLAKLRAKGWVELSAGFGEEVGWSKAS